MRILKNTFLITTSMYLLKIILITCFSLNTLASELGFHEPVNSFFKCIFREYCSDLGQKLVDAKDRLKFSKAICTDQFPPEIRPDLDFSESGNKLVSLRVLFNKQSYFFGGDPCSNTCASSSPANSPSQLLSGLTNDEKFKENYSSNCKHNQVLTKDGCFDLCNSNMFAVQKDEIRKKNILKRWDKKVNYNNKDLVNILLLGFGVKTPVNKEEYMCKSCNDTHEDVKEALRMVDGVCLGSNNCPPGEFAFTDPEQPNEQAECIISCKDGTVNKSGYCTYKDARTACEAASKKTTNILAVAEKDVSSIITALACDLPAFKSLMSKLFIKARRDIRKFTSECIRESKIYPEDSYNDYSEIPDLEYIVSTSEYKILTNCFGGASSNTFSDSLIEFISNIYEDDMVSSNSPYGIYGNPIEEIDQGMERPPPR